MTNLIIYQSKMSTMLGRHTGIKMILRMRNYNVGENLTISSFLFLTRRKNKTKIIISKIVTFFILILGKKIHTIEVSAPKRRLFIIREF